MKIFKYPVELKAGNQIVEMPEGAKILNAAMQDGVMNVWAMVSENKKLVGRKIQVIGTGWDINDSVALGLQYIGTIHTKSAQSNSMVASNYVWHLFEDLS